MADTPLPPSGDYGLANILMHWEAWSRLRRAEYYRSEPIPVGLGETAYVSDFSQVVLSPPSGSLEAAGEQPVVRIDGELLLQAQIVTFGEKMKEGQLVNGVTIAWEEILKEIGRDPDFLTMMPWRKVEELIAAAYEREGWAEVILTPRSADKGRDVIATKPGIGSIRIIDSVMAYKPGNLVRPDDVRALVGILRGNVSKGVLTTTSDFAPSIFEDNKDLIPYRLELKNGKQLCEWLTTLRTKPSQ